jgi:hypothetical protein
VTYSTVPFKKTSTVRDATDGDDETMLVIDLNKRMIGGMARVGDIKQLGLLRATEVYR